MYNIFEVTDNETNNLVYIGCIEENKDVRSILKKDCLLTNYINSFHPDRFSFDITEYVDTKVDVNERLTELVEFWKPMFYNENHSYDVYMKYKDKVFFQN